MINSTCSRCGKELTSAVYKSWTGAELCYECKQKELDEFAAASIHNTEVNEKED